MGKRNPVDEMMVLDALGESSSISSNVSWLMDNHFINLGTDGKYFFVRKMTWKKDTFAIHVDILSNNGECTASVHQMDGETIWNAYSTNASEYSKTLNEPMVFSSFSSEEAVKDAVECALNKIETLEEMVKKGKGK